MPTMQTADATAVVDSPMGPVSLQSLNGRLLRIEIDDHLAEVRGSCRLLDALSDRLEHYFSGQKSDFQMFENQLTAAPTPWQQQVREAMLQIGWGQVLSYGDLAELAGGDRRRHARAAGMACGANMFPLLVPCHRVLEHDGGLGGFGGGLDRKRFLLNLEGHHFVC